MTWMRKMPNVHRIDMTERAPDAAAEEVQAALGR
jgi:tRNA A37 N6-isopentenylltransferase MiaA